MVHVRGVIGLGLGMGMLLLAGSSRAAEADAPVKSVEFSAGVLGLAGGNYFTTPDDIVPSGYEGLGFAGDAGGFGWGLAAYGDARFVRHLGLTLTLGYDRSVLQREVTFNQVLPVDERISIGSTRLGLLAKGILPTPFGRLWLGLGPQFTLSTSAELEIESSGQPISPESRAEEVSSTLLDFGGGLVIHAGERIEIPFQILVSRNMSQDSEWLERVTPTSLTSYTVKAQSSWEFRMGIGVGARF